MKCRTDKKPKILKEKSQKETISLIFGCQGSFALLRWFSCDVFAVLYL